MIDRERLKEALRRNGFSQAELARRAGLSAAAVQQLVNGKVRRSRALPEIAEALSVNPDWLEGRAEHPTRHFIASNDARDDELVYVPYLARSDTPWIEEGELAVARLTFSKSWLTKASGLETLGVLLMGEVVGSAMSPTLLPGDDLLIVPTDTWDGDIEAIWLVSLEDRSMTRRIRAMPTGMFHIISDNPNSPNFEAAPGELSFKGKVVWFGRSLNAP